MASPNSSQSQPWASQSELVSLAFPYANPYPAQQSGISTTLDVVGDRGYHLIEGACGTGKTLLALTAAVALMRSKQTPIQRTLVVTNMKQQIRAFESDIEAINDSLADARDTSPLPAHEKQLRPVQSITAVGKADLCPLVASGASSPQSIYDDCSTLQANTNQLISEAYSGVERQMVATKLQEDAISEDTPSWPADRPDDHAATREAMRFGGMPDEHDDTKYCAYYAGYKSGESPPPGGSSRPVTRPQDIVNESVEQGTCPHEGLKQSVRGNDIVIGNYAHAFNPDVINGLTDKVIESTTLLIVDEAHELIPSLRDMASRKVPFWKLRKAGEQTDALVNEIETRVNGTFGDPLLNSLGRSRAHPGGFRTFAKSGTLLPSELGDWVQSRLNHPEEDELTPNEHRTLSLQDPTEAETDLVSEWLAENQMDTVAWGDGRYYGETIDRFLTEYADINPPFATSEVGQLFELWANGGNMNYHRTVTLTPRSNPPQNPSFEWQRTHRAALEINNTLPRSRVLSQLEEFGGGVLMSATLSPFWVFESEIGKSIIDRPIETSQYTLPFPPENRSTLFVGSEAFTYENRGSHTEYDPHPSTTLPQARADVVEAARGLVSNTPGNVLLALPSYGEADWLGTYLERSGAITKPVLVDESSSQAETEQLKERFFTGGPKVLTTSMRGTLTTGVNYEGDKLAAAAVIGIPVDNPSDELNKAIQAVYEEEFDAGFNLAFIPPAVRMARQAIGRVIRKDDDVGIRAFIDSRYSDPTYQAYIPQSVCENGVPVSPDAVDDQVASFWQTH
ncbi:ATP-dependent DNA helicase [Halobaculum sp. MBLA0147]|uniref:ATP-dependent DNA helicase n=1 Tax=Halobaculum sp. MBLA0147 TaxID=3079934 RepID=UPI003525C869